MEACVADVAILNRLITCGIIHAGRLSLLRP